MNELKHEPYFERVNADRPYPVPGSKFYEESAARSACRLPMLDRVSVEPPSAYGAKRYWRRTKEMVSRTFACLLVFCDGHWQVLGDGIIRMSSDDPKAVFGQFPGAFGIIEHGTAYNELASRDKRSASKVAVNLANTITACGYMPDGIDKIICCEEIDEPLLPEDDKPVVLYSMNRGDAIVPASAFTVSDDVCDFREPLRACDGRIKANVAPTPEAQDFADSFYAEIWRDRVVAAANTAIQDVVPCPRGLTSKHYELDDLKAILAALYGSEDTAECLFEYGFSIPETRDEVSKWVSYRRMIADSEVPMSPEAAALCLDKGRADMGEIAGVVEIWKRFLGRYNIRFSELGEGECVPGDQIRYLKMLGRDLGIYEGVKAYLSGANLDHIIEPRSNVEYRFNA